MGALRAPHLQRAADGGIQFDYDMAIAEQFRAATRARPTSTPGRYYDALGRQAGADPARRDQRLVGDGNRAERMVEALSRTRSW